MEISLKVDKMSPYHCSGVNGQFKFVRLCNHLYKSRVLYIIHSFLKRRWPFSKAEDFETYTTKPVVLPLFDVGQQNSVKGLCYL